MYLFQQIPDASPLGRFTTIIPLSFILCLSAIKSIIQDIVSTIHNSHLQKKRRNYPF